MAGQFPFRRVGRGCRDAHGDASRRPAFGRCPPQRLNLGRDPGLALCLLICLIGGQPIARYSLGQVGFVSRAIMPEATGGPFGSAREFQGLGRAGNSAVLVDTWHQTQQVSEPTTGRNDKPYPAVGIAADEHISFPAEDDFVSLPNSESTLRADVDRSDNPRMLQVIVSGSPAGELEFSDESQILRVRLGSLLNLVCEWFEAGEFARLSQSSAASEFVAVDVLATMGIPIRYDPVYDELVLELPSGNYEQVPSKSS